MKIIKIISLIIILSKPTSAQYNYFSNRYDFNQSAQEVGFDALPVNNGFIIIDGTTNSPGFSGNIKIGIFFIDSIGVKLWQKFYGRYRANYAPGIGGSFIKVNNGNQYVLGGSYIDSVNHSDVLLIKFNLQGDTLWSKTYGDTLFQFGQQVKETRDKGFVIVGQTAGSPVSNSEVLLIKTDSSGNFEWQKHFGGTHFDIGWAIDTCIDGGFVIAGYTQSYGTNAGSACGNLYCIKTDSMGNRQWDRAFGGQFGDGAYSVVQGRDSSLIFGGYATAFDPSASTTCDNSIGRPWLVKLDLNGNTKWSKTYGNSFFDTSIFMVRELQDGSIVSAGAVGRDTTGGAAQGLVLKVNSEGDSLWYRRYEILHDAHSNNLLRDIRQTPDGGFIAGGVAYVASPDTGTTDIWVLRIDSNGCEVSNCLVNSVSKSEMFTNEVFMFPNPSNNLFHFKMESGSEISFIQITNVLGEIVPVPVTTSQVNAAVDLTQQPCGIYFYSLKTRDNKFFRGKLVKE